MSVPQNDGVADMRYTVSKEAVASGAIEPDEKLPQVNDTIPTGNNEGLLGESSLSDVPTKSDGTADMRFTESQEAVASGDISRDQVLSGGDSIGGSMEGSLGMMSGAEGSGGPSKADGTPNMRFSANQ